MNPDEEVCPHCNAKLQVIIEPDEPDGKAPLYVKPGSDVGHYRLSVVDMKSECQRIQDAHRSYQDIANEVGGDLEFPPDGGPPSLVVEIEPEEGFEIPEVDR